MRMLTGIVVMVWLISGTVAAGDRGLLDSDAAMDCRTGVDTALTVLVGPVNYLGVAPAVGCEWSGRAAAPV